MKMSDSNLACLFFYLLIWLKKKDVQECSRCFAQHVVWKPTVVCDRPGNLAPHCHLMVWLKQTTKQVRREPVIGVIV